VVTKPDSLETTRKSAPYDAFGPSETEAAESRSGGRTGFTQGPGRLLRDCAHQRSHHEHGTRTAYVLDRCRCGSCTAANRFEAQKRRKAIAYGRWDGLVPAHVARRHVKELRTLGFSLQRIATLSGVGYGTVSRLTYGNPSGRQPPTGRIRHDTEQRLLNLRPEAGSTSPGGRVEATGSRRRLQALVAAGWPLPILARRLGRSTGNLRRTMHSGRVTNDSAHRIATMYEQLRHTTPPDRTPSEREKTARARAHAREAGWLPPWAWDDIDDIDDIGDLAEGDDETHPGEAFLDEIAIEHAMRGEPVRLTRTERDEAIMRLTNRGDSARCISQLLGTSSRQVVRRRAARRVA
jgi:hypothetical protein